MGTRRKPSRRQLLIGLWAVVILLLVLVATARGGTVRPAEAHPCTHGASSIGPVEIVDGKIVGGSAAPHTEACLP